MNAIRLFASSLLHSFRDHRIIFALLLFFTLIQAYYFNKFGVIEFHDTSIYLTKSKNLLLHFSQLYQYTWYSSYIILLSIFPHQDLTFLIGFQILISCIGIYYLYHSIVLLTSRPYIGILICIFYMFMLDYFQWHLFILPDSIFLSLLFIQNYYYLQSIQNGISKSFIIYSIILIFTKPTGFIVIFIQVIHLIYQNNKYSKYRRWWIVFTATIFLFSTHFILQAFELQENYALGEIFFNGSHSAYAKDLCISNETIKLNNVSSSTDMKAFYFVIQNPLYFAQLFFLKIFYTLSQLKPFNSTLHNIYNGIYSVLIYSIILFASIKYKNSWNLYFSLYFGIFCIVFGLTTVDWDNRFVIPLLPVLYTTFANSLHLLIQHEPINSIFKNRITK
jgi:hypothetical protein